ncbi:MAG: hypothetical protein Q7U68_06475 [Candidatus Roizmanbacteria bacterium]|nr:hypothetical protein [Candidatus Roizmanbacteria bacterium]
MNLEAEFTQALEGTIEAAKAHNYFPTYFMQMLGEYGGVGTARRLLAKQEIQQGLMKLAELELLKESMEAVVLQEKFRPLFTEAEVAEAHRRLEELGYFK